MPDLTQMSLAWRTSSVSAEINCVQVATSAEGVEVRHSKAPSGPRLIFTAAEWDAFIVGAQNGEFDLVALRGIGRTDTR